MKPILRNYFSDEGFDSVAAKFREIEGVPFTQFLTKWGLCLNFNLQPMESLLRVEKWAIFEDRFIAEYKSSLAAYLRIFSTSYQSGLYFSAKAEETRKHLGLPPAILLVSSFFVDSTRPKMICNLLMDST